MYEVLKVGKEVYPIRFGMNALRKYTKRQNITLSELGNIGETITLDDACVLILCGIEDGCRKAKRDVTITVEDIADALDDDMTIVEKAMEIFTEAFAPKNEENSKGGAKTPSKK
jgi:hypothetical protein